MRPSSLFWPEMSFTDNSVFCLSLFSEPEPQGWKNNVTQNNSLSGFMVVLLMLLTTCWLVFLYFFNYLHFFC